jgi:hypothetical protein
MTPGRHHLDPAAIIGLAVGTVIGMVLFIPVWAAWGIYAAARGAARWVRRRIHRDGHLSRDERRDWDRIRAGWGCTADEPQVADGD